MPITIFRSEDRGYRSLRSEEDDFKLTVEPLLDKNSEAVPIYFDNGEIAGWRVQSRYE